MKKKLFQLKFAILPAAIVAAIGLGSCDQSTEKTAAEEQRTPAVTTSETSLDQEVDVSNWPETAQKAAKAMMEKYGQPEESTPSMLVWHNTGPFKRTIVYKEEIQHDFPMPHKDVLEQFVNYLVPPDKFDELAMYDGSVIVERTKGEMSARCDKEAANYLALNLANDIVQGKRSVEEARKFYGNTMMEMLQGKKSPYLQSLQFEASSGNVGFADKTTMDMAKVKQLKQ